MLDTLLRIGEWQSQEKGQWARFLETPKLNSIDKKGNSIINYVLPIVFDLDAMRVVIEPANLCEYDQTLVESLKLLKVQGGNNKAIYASVLSNKLIQLHKTFFGKDNEFAKEGELSEAIRKEAPELLTASLSEILSKIFLLKQSFIDQATFSNTQSGIAEINLNAIETHFGLSKTESIALVYAAIKSSGTGSQEIYPFSQVPEYVRFLEKKFLRAAEKKTSHQSGTQEHKLCYASGLIQSDVGELDLSTRYSLNKMFVTETRNYASNFDKNNFRINYQVSKLKQEKLDFASNYLLNEGSYKVKIANVDHVIIPQFLSSDNIELDLALSGIKVKSDILFNIETMERAATEMRDETHAVFWINFVAFESDGNFFKSTEIIQDVSNFHFQNVIRAFVEVHWKFREASFIDWEGVMMDYGRKGTLFNLNTMYAQIPLRKDKEKKNRALDLFKAIMENRKISVLKLYGHFRELVLCHYYARYSSYTNIRKSTKDYFPKAIRDAVFKYLAFIQVLKKLKLVDIGNSA